MLSHQELTKQAGNFGIYQKRALLTLYCMILVSAAVIIICSVFVYYTPPHRCYVPELDDSNFTSNILPGISQRTNTNTSRNQDEIDLSNYIPVEEGVDGKLKWSQCYRYNDSVLFDNKLKNLTTNSGNVIKCDKGWKYFSPSGEISATMEFDLVCDRAYLVPLMSSVHMSGWMVGAIACGFLSDRFGRRFVLLIIWIILFTSFGLLAILPIWQLHFLLWFLIGIATAARSSTAVVIMNEVTPEKYRYAAGTINCITAAFCYMSVPLFNLGLKKWRYLLGLYCGLQCLAFIPLYCWTKESVLWLLQHGKDKKAIGILKEIARINKKNANFEHQDFLLNRKAIKLEPETNQESEAKSSRITLSYIHFVKIAFLRKRLIILGTAWFACNLGYFGVSLNTNDLGGDRYVACIIAGAVEIPGYILCFVSMRKLGGRRSCLILIGSGGICLLVTPLFLNGISIAPVVTCSMIGKLFVSGTFANLYIFTGDLFPTLLRNQSYGALSFIGRLAGVSVPFLLYIGKTYHESIPYLTMGILAILAAVGIWFLPETRKMLLPDTIEDAKNQDKVARTCHFKCIQSNDDDKKSTG